MNQQKSNVISSKRIYDGWFKVREDLVIVPRNGMKVKYAVLEAVDSIMVIPLTDENEVVLTSEYRHPIGESIYSLPSGRINSGETPEQAAVRELKEETGYSAGKLERICSGFIWPGISNMKITCFAATELILGERHQDDNEDIEIVIMSYDHLLREVIEGRQKNIQLSYAILAYEIALRKNHIL